jgi:hypothetical protein
MSKPAVPSPKQLYWIKKMVAEKPLDGIVKDTDGTEKTVQQIVDANYVEGMTAKTASWLLDILFAIEEPANDIPAGLYDHDGKVYLVKVGAKSQKPYAMLLTWDFTPEGKVFKLDYEAAKGVAHSLSADERVPVDIPEKTLKFAKAQAIGELYDSALVAAVLGEEV